MPHILLLVLNQIEQILFFVGGFGLSDLFIDTMNFSKKQKLMYFSGLIVIAFCILFYTGNN